MSQETRTEARLGERAREIASLLRRRLERAYGDRLRGVYLFGSHARGTAEPESDVDVLIVLDRIDGYISEVRRAGGAISELSLEYETSITPVFVSEEDWRVETSPFLRNVREEAIAA